MKTLRTIILLTAMIITSISSLKAQQCTLVLDKPEQIGEVTYAGTQMEIQATTSLSISWMGAKSLHVAPADGCQIDNVSFYDASWGETSSLPVGDDGCLDLSVDYNHAYGKITIYTSSKTVETPIFKLSFDLDDGAFEAITAVTVNGIALEAGWEQGVDVKDGANVALSLNTTDFKIDLFEIDGEPKTNYEFTVNADTELKLRAHRYSTVGATLVVNNPQGIKLYEGTSIYNRKEIEITDAIFHFEVAEKNPYVMIESANDNKLVSATDANGDDLSPELITVTPNMTINVSTAAIERNLNAVLFVGGLDACTEYGLTGAAGHKFDLNAGYQMVEFAPEDLPVELYLRGTLEDKNLVLHNDEPHTGTFFNWRHKLTLADGDLVLAFVDGTVEPFAVSVTGDTKEPYTVKRHMGEIIEDFSAFAMYYGTLLEIHPAAGSRLEVSAAITAIEELEPETTTIAADKDGVFRLNITGATNINVKDYEEPAAIESVISNEDSATPIFYDIRGIKLDKAPKNALYIELRGSKARLMQTR